MNTLLSMSFWLSFLLYLLSVLIVFFAPGFALLKRVKKQWPVLPRLVVSMSLGMAMWGAQGYIFGYLHARILTYAYIVICLFLLYIQRKDFLHYIKQIKKSWSSVDRF